MSDIETHPFTPFIPDNITTLIIGSFPGKEQTRSHQDDNQWYYGAKRNQFWEIISSVYNTPLFSKNDKQALLGKLGIGLTDILLKVRRKENNNMDDNLEIIEYNEQFIRKILDSRNIQSLFFTSKYVGWHFRQLFPEITNVQYLPSPSPRNARMSKTDKIKYYKSKLPNN